MTEERKNKLLDEAKRFYDHIDKYLQKEHALDWFGKSAVALRNARENMEFVIICLDNITTEGVKGN